MTRNPSSARAVAATARPAADRTIAAGGALLALLALAVLS